MTAKRTKKATATNEEKEEVQMQAENEIQQSIPDVEPEEKVDTNSIFSDAIDDDLAGSVEDNSQDQYYTRKLTPSPRRWDNFLVLERFKRQNVHQVWVDSRPHFFACGTDCQLCVAGEVSQPHMVARVYLTDDDQGVVLLLPVFDMPKTMGLNALRSLKAIAGTVGADIYRTPLELSMQSPPSGVRHIVLEADKDPDGKIVMFSKQDAEYVAAQTLREKLGDEPLLRMFSLDQDEKILPKHAKRIRKKLNLGQV